MQLFILLLLSHITVVTAVAGCHSDRDKDNRPRKNCTAAGFSDVPAGLEPSTQVLLFPNNLFSSLTWSSFQIFPDLYEINLVNNQVPQVTPSGSPVLPSLSVLWLSSNRLTSLSDGSFSACPALTELYLDNNTIDTLSNHTFSGLSKLEKLDLSSNRIKVLPELLLHPLPVIETLLLEENKITMMPDGWFSKKEMVPYLYLSANPWACSCSLDYLRRYLDDYEYNVYTRDGPDINNDAESVVCDSPQRLKGKSVITLEESDLCSPAPEPGLMERGDFYLPPAAATTPDKTTTSTTGIPTTLTVSPPSTTTTPTTTTVPTSHWSWYQSFTRFTEWPEYTGSVATSDAPLVLHSMLPHFKSSTESSVNMKTTEPAGTNKSSPTTLTSTNPQVYAVTATVTTPSWVVDKVGEQQHGQTAGVRGEGVFCFWLFAGLLMLCLASALCISVTLVRMVIWYKMMNKALSLSSARKARRSEGVRLLTEDGREKREVEGGVTEQFRSILFVNRGGEAVEVNDEGNEGERTQGGPERLLITLEPAGGEGVMGEGGGHRGRKENIGVYRKTLYRLISKEEEIEGWRDMMEECRVPAGEGGMDRERSGRGVSRKCYSIILREKREEAGGGREELDWVVGGWEVKTGGGEKEPRSSWGEWLAHYLPSMPWEVAVPPEGGTAL